MINETIARLRKQKGITQEELANALGVTNQAVSKWESAQCCPDISLLPDIADYFGVTLDTLFGHESSADDPISTVRTALEALPAADAHELALKLACLTHVVLASKEMTAGGNHGWNPDDAIRHAMNAEWGISRVCSDRFITGMRGGSVFFSNGSRCFQCESQQNEVVRLLRNFTVPGALTVFSALFELTADSEGNFTTPAEVAEKCGLPESAVNERLDALDLFLLKKDGRIRIDGKYMHIYPLLALLTIV